MAAVCLSQDAGSAGSGSGSGSGSGEGSGSISLVGNNDKFKAGAVLIAKIVVDTMDRATFDEKYLLKAFLTGYDIDTTQFDAEIVSIDFMEKVVYVKIYRADGAAATTSLEELKKSIDETTTVSTYGGGVEYAQVIGKKVKKEDSRLLERVVKVKHSEKHLRITSESKGKFSDKMEFEVKAYKKALRLKVKSTSFNGGKGSKPRSEGSVTFVSMFKFSKAKGNTAVGYEQSDNVLDEQFFTDCKIAEAVAKTDARYIGFSEYQVSCSEDKLVFVISVSDKVRIDKHEGVIVPTAIKFNLFIKTEGLDLREEIDHIGIRLNTRSKDKMVRYNSDTLKLEKRTRVSFGPFATAAFSAMQFENTITLTDSVNGDYLTNALGEEISTPLTISDLMTFQETQTTTDAEKSMKEDNKKYANKKELILSLNGYLADSAEYLVIDPVIGDLIEVDGATEGEIVDLLTTPSPTSSPTETPVLTTTNTANGAEPLSAACAGVFLSLLAALYLHGLY